MNHIPVWVTRSGASPLLAIGVWHVPFVTSKFPFKMVELSGGIKEMFTTIMKVLMTGGEVKNPTLTVSFTLTWLGGIMRVIKSGGLPVAVRAVGTSFRRVSVRATMAGEYMIWD